MGYVPGRSFEGLSGTLDEEGLRILLTASLEDCWFFKRQWLRGALVSFQPNEDEDGGELLISKVVIRSDKPEVFGDLAVSITAQGLVQVASVGDAERAKVLRRAIDRTPSDKSYAMFTVV